jgi:hypothetical protein
MLLHPLPDLRGRAIVPCSLTEDRPRDRVPGFGDPAGSNGAAAAMFTRRQSEVRNELARMGKSGEVADLGDNRCRNDWTDAFESLQRRQQRCPM